MRHREVDGLSHFPNGKATVRELSIGEMRRIRRDYKDEEERSLAILAAAIVDPVMTIADLDAMGTSEVGDLTRLSEVIGELNRPEVTGTDPPA
jgi:hypothetical protein